MLKNLTFWAEIDEIDGFLVIFYSSKILVQGLTTNGHHKSFFCYLFYVAIYMRYLKSVVRPLVLFFWEVCVSGLQWFVFISRSFHTVEFFFQASCLFTKSHKCKQKIIRHFHTPSIFTIMNCGGLKIFLVIGNFKKLD